MSDLLEEIRKERAEMKVPSRRAIGDTATKLERNKRICRKYWSGEMTQKALAEEYGCHVKTIHQLITSVDKKIKKSGLKRSNYLDN